VQVAAASAAGDLSGANRQRVAIAGRWSSDRASCSRTSRRGNLDSRTGQAILDLLRELNRATQLTVIS